MWAHRVRKGERAHFESHVLHSCIVENKFIERVRSNPRVCLSSSLSLFALSGQPFEQNGFC